MINHCSFTFWECLSELCCGLSQSSFGWWCDVSLWREIALAWTGTGTFHDKKSNSLSSICSWSHWLTSLPMRERSCEISLALPEISKSKIVLRKLTWRWWLRTCEICLPELAYFHDFRRTNFRRDGRICIDGKMNKRKLRIVSKILIPVEKDKTGTDYLKRILAHFPMDQLGGFVPSDTRSVRSFLCGRDGEAQVWVSAWHIWKSEVRKVGFM